jgi:hypothetical protein
MQGGQQMYQNMGMMQQQVPNSQPQQQAMNMNQ